MPDTRDLCRSKNSLVGNIAFSVAILFCVLLGLAMIINNQMEGDAMWYWYAVLFHQGVKLYSDLHIALQPLFILQWDVWMHLFGHRTIATESMAVINLIFLVAGLYLFLRESDWPEWQKAVLIVGGFVFWTCGTSYRFDDYHVTTESFVLFSTLLLLKFAQTESALKQAAISIALGVLCAFTITSRINDGAALLVVVAFSMVVIATRRRWVETSLFAFTAILVTLLIIHCTGDTTSAWLSNTLFHAAASKGGTHSIFLDPLRLVVNALKIPTGGKLVFVCALLLFPIGAGITRVYKSISTLQLVAIQILLSVFFCAVSSHTRREQYLSDSLIKVMIPAAIIVNCVLALVVAVRFILWLANRNTRTWDKREILILIPLAMWASIATSAAGLPLTGYYSQVVLMFFLVAALQPFAKQIPWANASFITILLLSVVVGVKSKYETPYFWNNTRTPRMFTNRKLYQHPVYGTMYIDTSLLRLNRTICSDVGMGSSNTLLSLPYSYPNYFCDTPPWHGYVETFFDTTEHSTVEQLIHDLNESPPQFIAYQRQLKNLIYHEKVFNNGQRLPQHDLDDLIMQKISSGKWQLLDRIPSEYGDGWYIIRTRTQPTPNESTNPASDFQVK